MPTRMRGAAVPRTVMGPHPTLVLTAQARRTLTVRGLRTPTSMEAAPHTIIMAARRTPTPTAGQPPERLAMAPSIPLPTARRLTHLHTIRRRPTTDTIRRLQWATTEQGATTAAAACRVRAPHSQVLW